MDLLAEGRALHADLVRLRRDLHREPEIGLRLPRTQERVLAALDGLPLEISTGVASTSVTAVLRGQAGAGPTVLLRGDMDALPVVEQARVEFAATNGAMHACGHDLHTSALAGAARLLAAHRDRLAGDVVFMFQPGEEGWHGAATMIEEGVLDASGRRADHAYALHVLSNRLPTGAFLSRPGVILSASHRLDVTVHGAGGHGSSPHTARDPIIATADMIMTLQAMVTRRFDMFDPVVLTVGAVHAGNRHNVIPETATFQATARTLSEASAAKLHQAVPAVLNGVAAAHGVTVEIDLVDEYPRTVNDAGEMDFARGVLDELLGAERYLEAPTPISGSEDFSLVLDAVPGAFVFLGACPPDLDPQEAPMNHSPHAVFDDAVLADAAAVYAALAAARLSGAVS